MACSRVRPSRAIARTSSMPFHVLAPAVISRTFQQRARFVDAARRVGGHIEEHGHGPRAIERRRPVQAIGDGAFDAKGVGEHERAVAADPPGIAAGAAQHVLAHRRAAENQGLDGEQARVAGKRDLGAPIEPGLVEEDGGLRQPGEAGAGARSSLTPICGLAIAGAIDFLGRGVVTVASVPAPSVTAMSMRSPPVSPPAVLSSTASGGAPAPGLGKRTRAAPA